MLRLDKYDIAIMETLQREGRITKLRLSELVHLSQTPCHERIRRLEKHKLIREYNAQIDLAKVGRSSTFFVTVILESHREKDFQTFESNIERYEQVTECHALGGGIDYLLKVVERDVVSYQCLMENLLARRIGISRYYTHIVTKRIFGPRAAPLSYIFASERAS